jgi:hypothetical protein
VFRTPIFDTEQQADGKSQTANKKHRLHVDDVQVIYFECTDDQKHAFRLEVLDGRIAWKLAAKTPNEKQQWKQSGYFNNVHNNNHNPKYTTTTDLDNYGTNRQTHAPLGIPSPDCRSTGMSMRTVERYNVLGSAL